MAASGAPRPVALRRRALAFDVFDDAAFHEGLLAQIERQIIFAGGPQPAIHLYCDDHEEWLDWSGVEDPQADVAATFAALGGGIDVVRAVVVAILEEADGASSAFALELSWDEGAPDRWWSAVRGYEVNSAGVGRLRGRWRMEAGQGPVPPPFRRLAELRPGARPVAVLPARRGVPDIRVAFGELPAGLEAIDGVDRLLGLAAALFLPDVTREGIDHVKVLRLCGRAWEEWRLGGELPADLDDMARYIAGRGQAAEGIVLAQGIIFPEDGEPTKALKLVGEQGGLRQERIFTFVFPEGRRSPSRGYRRSSQPVVEGEGWLGVDPMVSFTLGPIGPEA